MKIKYAAAKAVVYKYRKQKRFVKNKDCSLNAK